MLEPHWAGGDAYATPLSDPPDDQTKPLSFDVQVHASFAAVVPTIQYGPLAAIESQKSHLDKPFCHIGLELQTEPSTRV